MVSIIFRSYKQQVAKKKRFFTGEAHMGLWEY